MKKLLLISAAAVALLITPVLAQQNGTTGQAVQTQKKLPRLSVGPGLIRGNDVYDCTGKYLGSDPNVRHQILREGDPSCAAQ